MSELSELCTTTGAQRVQTAPSLKFAPVPHMPLTEDDEKLSAELSTRPVWMVHYYFHFDPTSA